MPTAKTLFLERIDALHRSSTIDSVTNHALSETVHNSVARMLRNGLAVVGFAALEDFIKTRTSEVLTEVGRTSVPFNSLPDKLIFAATINAVSALSYQLSIRPKTDRIAYIQEHSQKIASTSGSAYEITPHAFGYDQANIQDSTVKEILKSFKVDDAWGNMTMIASRIGLTALPLEETFKSASIRRHRAAHVAHADTPQGDISQFVKEAYAIAIAFDALLSKALSKLQQYDQNYLSNNGSVSAQDIKIRTIRYNNNIWKEFLEGRVNSVKNEIDISILKPLTQARANHANNLLIIFDENGQIKDWECY